MIRILLLCSLFCLNPALGQQSVDGKTGSSTHLGNSAKQNNVFSESDKDTLIKQIATIVDNTTVDHDAVKRQENREYKALEIQQADLVQQQIMATFTERLFWVALVQIGIGMLGLWLIWKTLRATNVAALAAQDSARAAEDAIKQNRAWIVFDEHTHNFDNPTPGNFCELIYFWKNAGETPAFNVEAEFRVDWSTEKEVGRHGIPIFKPSERLDIIGVLGPGVRHTGYISFTEDQVNRLANKISRCFIYTFIKYKTIYSGEVFHITETVEEIKAIHHLVPIIGRDDIAQRKTEYQIKVAGPQQRAT